MSTITAYFLSFIYLLEVGELIEGIFKFGFWTAIIVVVLIVLVAVWIIRKVRRRG